MWARLLRAPWTISVKILALSQPVSPLRKEMASRMSVPSRKDAAHALSHLGGTTRHVPRNLGAHLLPSSVCRLSCYFTVPIVQETSLYVHTGFRT